MASKPRLKTLQPRVPMLDTSRGLRTVTPGSWRSGKTTAERGYGGRWQRARADFLRANPLCQHCKDEGAITPASVVDHVEPHRGDESLMWDESNWMPLCKPHHDAKTGRGG